nr:MAG TPA: hypothetical protein [Caudoviricetes sp.]
MRQVPCKVEHLNKLVNKPINNGGEEDEEVRGI